MIIYCRKTKIKTHLLRRQRRTGLEGLDPLLKFVALLVALFELL